MKNIKLSSIIMAFLFIPGLMFSQTKLVIDDQESVLTAKTDSLLKIKLSQNNLEYTSLVDFKKKCDYYFAEINDSNGSINLSIKKCDNDLLGSKNLGITFKKATDEEKTILLGYAILEILENPNSQITSTKPIPEKTDLIEAIEIDQEPEEEVFGKLNNEHDTRHFFSPSSYNLREGELYYNTIYFLIHDLQYGISDRFSFGMGTTIGGFPFYLTPKLTIPIDEKNALAIGDLLILGTYSVDFVANLSYVTYTRGTKIKNFTTGLGFLNTTDGDITGNTNSFVLNLSGMTRISKYMYFISENYFFKLKNKNSASYYLYNPQTGQETSFETDFIRNNFHIFGISGFRFVSKRRDVQSFQVGLTYFYINRDDIPTQYTGSNWYVDGNEKPTSSFIFPTISYTLKFGKKY